MRAQSAAGLLLLEGRTEEAFRELEHQVAVQPLNAYGEYATLLMRAEQTRIRNGKGTQGPALRHLVDDIRRFFEVQQQLRGAQREEDDILDAFDEFIAWEAELPLDPPPVRCGNGRVPPSLTRATGAPGSC